MTGACSSSGLSDDSTNLNEYYIRAVDAKTDENMHENTIFSSWWHKMELLWKIRYSGKKTISNFFQIEKVSGKTGARSRTGFSVSVEQVTKVNQNLKENVGVPEVNKHF